VVDALAVDNSTHLLWIGLRQSKKVILFFHGIIFPFNTPFPRIYRKSKRWRICDAISEGHLDWMAYIMTETVNAGVQLSICILE